MNRDRSNNRAEAEVAAEAGSRGGL
jgi:hypothetical protein